MKDKATFQNKVKVLNKLFDSGCDTEKKLQQLDMEAILKIPNITIPDMGVIMELQKNTKSGKLFSYLGGGSDEATKMRGKEMKQQENRAEPQEKQIRFIDSHYNLKFYIPDGGKIRITFRDGHIADRVCKYIDDYHLYVGNCCYHICEFAEKLELSGSKVEPINQSEPSKNKTRNREKQR